MDTAELGKVLRARRKKLGLSVQQAATTAGVSTETWYAVESGRYTSSLKPDNQAAMLEALALPPDGSAPPEPSVEDLAREIHELREHMDRQTEQLEAVLRALDRLGRRAR